MEKKQIECPNCGNKLNKHPNWAEYVKQYYFSITCTSCMKYFQWNKWKEV